jgi:rare lipoprotein A
VFHKNYWRFDPDISWYGPGFYGSGTACGQQYTREVMGVAHRSLPCGTLVTFRNTVNGRQVTVPVIDRGPYVTGRTWDMSRALCEYLDHCYTGTIEWRWGGGGR